MQSCNHARWKLNFQKTISKIRQEILTASEQDHLRLTRVPLPGRGIHLSVHLLRADGLGVEPAVLVRDSDRLVQRHAKAPENLRLSAPGRTYQHDAVPYQRSLVQLWFQGFVLFLRGWGW